MACVTPRRQSLCHPRRPWDPPMGLAVFSQLELIAPYVNGKPIENKLHLHSRMGEKSAANVQLRRTWYFRFWRTQDWPSKQVSSLFSDMNNN